MIKREMWYWCFECRETWVVPVQELRLRISDEMTQACVNCEQDLCGDCVNNHIC